MFTSMFLILKLEIGTNTNDIFTFIAKKEDYPFYFTIHLIQYIFQNLPAYI